MSTENSSPNLFSSDRPITSRDQDELGRRTFSEEISRAVRGWKGQVSFALYGPWGTGKSSIKNMVIDALRVTPDAATVIDFNPWQVSHREQLSQAFFDEIGIAIGKGPLASRKDQQKAASKWKRYAARLKSTGGVLNLFVKPIRWTLLVSAILIVGSTIPILRPLAIVSAILYVLVGLLTWSSTFAEQLAAFHEAGTDREPLEDVKTSVRKELAKLPAPILVLIDDLDRLTPSELLEMFQLVKANGDFPNLVYLLLCDRPIVENHIEEVIKGAVGRDYLEKIVQVGFDVPLMDRKRVHELLFKGLNTLLADEAVSKHFDQTRWGNVFLGGLRPYFGTLRQVNRFLSTLSFHVALFRTGGSFEVNVIDLIGLEALRVNEPELYHVLRENKDLLTKTSDLGGGNRDEERKKITTILDLVPQARSENVRDLIKHLFPTIEWAVGGSHYGADFGESWFRELRVCSEDMFDRYFHFDLPKGDLSQATINRLLSKTADREALRHEFEALSSKGTLELAMDRLEAYKQQIPIEHAVPFITALFDVGDNLSSDTPGMFEISPAMHAERIVYWYLKLEADPEKRGDAILAATEQTRGLTLPVGFASLIEPKKEEGRASEEFVSADTLTRLKKLCVQKIKVALKSGQLPKELGAVLFRWQAWAGPEEPTKFCEELIQSRDGLLLFLRAFLVCAKSHGLSDFVVKSHWYIGRADIEAFLPFDLVESKVNSWPEDLQISQEDERALSAFKKAAERRRAGKSDENPFAMD